MERLRLCKNCYPRIFQTILAVTIVNAYLGHQWECIDAGKNEDQIINFKDFAGQLAYQMIFNIHLNDTPSIITRPQSYFQSVSSPTVSISEQQSSTLNSQLQHEIEKLSTVNAG